MKTKHNIFSQFSLSSGLAVALALGVCLPGASRAGEETKGALHLQHITTQAQAEALMPGDSMSMTCSKCKNVMVQKVTTDNAHVKMMTVGEKVMCHGCDGTVEVVATGKGKEAEVKHGCCSGTVAVVATGKGTGKDAEVKHVCSKCGDDALFCSATKSGSSPMKGMEETKGAQHLLNMQRITTQAQAEAMKPGDAMSMICSKCKDVMVQNVTTDKTHVKMMTVGEKFMCKGCDGTVEIVATGKGTGKDAEVKHVCSKCGDDAMFCAATKSGSGAMKGMEKEQK